jgi:hypothetical protein
MIKEGKNIISLLSKAGIFNVTESEIIHSNKGYIHYEDTYKVMMNGAKQILMDSMQSWLKGYEQAQTSAYSQVTGTGISMWSNSMIAHATLAAYETSTIKKQCAKAEKEYQMVMESLDKRTNSEEERKYVNLFAVKIYPEIATSFSMYTNELMNFYLEKLQEHTIYNYSKIIPYDIKRSSELLNNISLVDDKKSVLIEAFKNCPYNPDIYAKALDLKLYDLDTFKTAKEFYQDSVLVNVVEDYCKKNLKSNKVSNAISILAYYKGAETKDIWRSMYGRDINGIESKYIELHAAIKDNAYLCRWIKDYITSSTDTLLKESIDDITAEIKKRIDNIVSENLYEKYITMDLIRPETLRLSNSQSTDRGNINTEIAFTLMECVKEYIKEATKRRDEYLVAQRQYEKGVEKINTEISYMKNDLSALGLFAFSKKKELNSSIARKESELEAYKKDNVPDILYTAFEKMYI